MSAPDGRTFSQRWADRVTEFSGSWAFILIFTLICVAWVGAQRTALQFDPYPFLFLNWALTVVSTLQSPIILLSQNRQNETDRANVAEILRRLEVLQKTLGEAK